MSSKNPKVALITLNWNGKKLLDISFPCLAHQTYKNLEVWVVENGSTDGSKEYIKKNYPQFHLVDLNYNSGFATGNNLAYQKLSSDVDYIVTLNNDVWVHDTFVENFVRIAELHPEYSAFAPKIVFYYDKDIIDSCGIVIGQDGGGMNRGFKEKDAKQYNEEEEVFGPCAGAALYRKAAIDEVGFFDDDFFAYYEDLDLAWRLRHAGYKTLYTPEVLVEHLHSATGVSHSPFKAFHVQRNRLLVIVKNFPFFLSLWTLLILTPWRYFHLLRSAIIKQGPSAKLAAKAGKSSLIKITFSAWISFLHHLPKMINKSLKIKKQNPRVWMKQFPADFKKMIYLD